MAIAHDPAPSERRRLNWLGDNPVLRAVGRVPPPLGGTLLQGFTVSTFRFILPATQAAGV
jgi:hypothetical protein